MIITGILFIIIGIYFFTVERRLSLARECAQSHRETIENLIEGIRIINSNQITIARAINRLDGVSVSFENQELEFPFSEDENTLSE